MLFSEHQWIKKHCDSLKSLEIEASTNCYPTKMSNHKIKDIILKGTSDSVEKRQEDKDYVHSVLSPKKDYSIEPQLWMKVLPFKLKIRKGIKKNLMTGIQISQ